MKEPTAKDYADMILSCQAKLAESERALAEEKQEMEQLHAQHYKMSLKLNETVSKLAAAEAANAQMRETLVALGYETLLP